MALTLNPEWGDMCFNAGQNPREILCRSSRGLMLDSSNSPGSRLGLQHVATIVAKNF